MKVLTLLSFSIFSQIIVCGQQDKVDELFTINKLNFVSSDEGCEVSFEEKTDFKMVPIAWIQTVVLSQFNWKNVLELPFGEGRILKHHKKDFDDLEKNKISYLILPLPIALDYLSLTPNDWPFKIRMPYGKGVQKNWWIRKDLSVSFLKKVLEDSFLERTGNSLYLLEYIDR